MDWIESLLAGIKSKRRTVSITFDSHLIMRESTRNLDLRKVEETVRSGIVVPSKCAPPRKLCFQRYFGKENITYTVVVMIHQYFLEVITCWTKKGR